MLHPFLCSQEVWRRSQTSSPRPAASRCSHRRWSATTAARRRAAGCWTRTCSPTSVERQTRRAGLGDGAHRRQLAGRLGVLRAGAPRPGPFGDRDRACRRLDRSTRRRSIEIGAEVHRSAARCCWPPDCSGHGSSTCRSPAASPRCRSAVPPTGPAIPTCVDPDRRRHPLPGLLPAADQDAARCRACRSSPTSQRPTHLVLCEKDRVVPHSAVQQALHREPAADLAGEPTRRRRPHPDARGAWSGHRTDRRLRRRAHRSAARRLGRIAPHAGRNRDCAPAWRTGDK